VKIIRTATERLIQPVVGDTNAMKPMVNYPCALTEGPAPPSGGYQGFGATVLGCRNLATAVTQELARKGIERFHLAAADILAPPYMPISDYFPRRAWAFERQQLAEAASRINPQIEVIQYSHRLGAVGPHWLRCAIAGSVIAIHVGHHGATAGLMNLVCSQQVIPSVYANYNSVSGIGCICFVVPRCSGIQNRGFRPTRCWECTTNGYIDGDELGGGPVPAWFADAVMEYCDALLLERRSAYAALLAPGPNCVTFQNGRAIAFTSATSPRKNCNLCF
jgi:hypothetical protein